MKNLVAFIGFGEAAYFIAKGLKSEGLNNMIAYDIMQDDAQRGSFIRNRAADAGIILADSIEGAYKSAKFVLSLTNAAVAIDVAKSVIPNLVAGQIYVDPNSVAPKIETAIDEIPRANGVDFVDVAILGSVPAGKHKVNCYICGSGAQEFYDTFTPYNMNLTLLKDAKPGAASAIKMFRSCFAKGMPQLLFETFASAKYFGVLEEVLGTFNTEFKGKTIEEIADRNFCRTVIHSKRQAAEMADVVKTVEGLGLDASMSKGTYERFAKLADLKLVDEIGPDADLNFRETIDLILKKIKP